MCFQYNANTYCNRQQNAASTSSSVLSFQIWVQISKTFYGVPQERDTVSAADNIFSLTHNAASFLLCILFAAKFKNQRVQKFWGPIFPVWLVVAFKHPEMNSCKPAMPQTGNTSLEKKGFLACPVHLFSQNGMAPLFKPAMIEILSKGSNDEPNEF